MTLRNSAVKDIVNKRFMTEFPLRCFIFFRDLINPSGSQRYRSNPGIHHFLRLLGRPSGLKPADGYARSLNDFFSKVGKVRMAGREQNRDLPRVVTGNSFLIVEGSHETANCELRFPGALTKLGKICRPQRFRFVVVVISLVGVHKSGRHRHLVGVA
jgi:hypothetical protein